MFKGTIALITLLILLASCGQTTETQEEVIKIGFIGPLTGDVAVYGVPGQKSVELAADEINAAGGINGKQIKVIYEDTKCSGKDGVNSVTKLVSVDKVKAIVGGLCSAVSIPANTVAEKSKIVMISYGASSPALSENTPYFFRTFPSDAFQARIGAGITLDEGYEKIAVIYRNDEYGSGFKEKYVSHITEGIDGKRSKIVAVETYNPDAVDFKTQIQKLISANPDFLYMITFPKEGGLIAKQAKEAGLNVPKLGVEAMNDPSLVETGGDATEGIRFTFPKAGEGIESEHYKEAYFEMHGEEVGVFGSTAYDAVYLFAKAMEDCGESGDQIKQCLEATENYPGASGTINFDEYGDILKEYTLFEVKDGEFVS